MDAHFNKILTIFKQVNEGQVEKNSTGLKHTATDKYGAGDEPFNPFNPGKYARDITHLNKDLTSKLDKSMDVTHSHGNTKDVDENVADSFDRVDKNITQQSANREQEMHDLAAKLGGRPPTQFEKGTGIFASMNVPQFQHWLESHPQVLQMLHGTQTTQENSMTDAEHNPAGAQFGGYWKGTDPNPPKPGMGVGGAAESIEEQIAREYAQYLNEYGMTTGGMAGTGSTANNPVDQAKMNKEIQQTQQNLNKVKAAGVPLPSGVGQAAKSTVTTVNNPAANASGQGMDQQAKKTAMGLGQEMEKLMTTGSQSQVQQVANIIKQAKLGQK